MQRWLAKSLLCCALAAACVPIPAAASSYFGKVTFGGLPVPGATIMATHGKLRVSVTTDEGGLFRFPDLADGNWNLDITLQCFVPIHAGIAVTANAAPGRFELQLLPIDQLKALAKTVHPRVLAPPVLRATNEKRPDTPNVPIDIPKPPDEANQQSSDGLLVNGSVNNAATSQFSLNQAFGNRRSNSRSLYNGGFALVLDNSALDARQFSISGYSTPKPVYDRITGGITFGGPLKIPHLLPRGPNLFFAYQWARNHTALIDSALVPTDAERSGDLFGAIGQPATILNPGSGLPYPGSIVPVSAQAQALLKLYPQPNVSGNPLYNYQVPVLNSTHQDVLTARLDKTLGRRDQLYGNFNFQSIRADNVNLFQFVDTTDTLGLNTSVNWAHRFNQHLFIYLTYRFSRQRILVRPEYDGKENYAGAAGITGNDQAPADWGPPSLSFTSGIAALSDAQSAFNRNRTDGYSASVGIYRGRHNITAGGDLRKQQYNDFFQQDPRGTFTFTGAATGSDLADFLVGVPDASSIAFGNADKYLRQPVYDAYVTDDWRVLPILTINAGMRWEYGAPMTELYGRLVNVDVTPGFTQIAPVLGSDPVGSLTGQHYPSSLVRPDRDGIEPRIGLSWRPIPASTVVVRAGYGVYHDTSVYLTPMLDLAQQAPLSKSVKEQNSPACPLTLAEGFISCPTTTADTFGIDPNFRVGYAQTWQLSVQRDLPGSLQGVLTYLGVKGTRGVQEFLPNSYPLGVANPCPDCPAGLAYETSNGDSTRESGQVQLRRRLRAGFTASLLYTYSKSIDDDAMLGGQGHTPAVSQSESSSSSSSTTTAATSQNAAIAQDWLSLKAERSLSSFDQRHLLNLTAQYTTGQGLEGGTLLGGWPGRLLKEWTILTQISAGSGLPETPIDPEVVPGTGFFGSLRPSLTGAPIYTSVGNTHLNAAAYTTPSPGTWGGAGRDSIEGPSQFSLDTAIKRTFRPTSRYFLDARLESTNLLNHAVFSGWVTTIDSTQFGQPLAANPMRSIETTLRLRF